MHVELLTIGNELLLGQVVDTNAAELAQTLAGAGIQVRHRSTVGDDTESIASEVRQALERSGAVITTGGLGPTRDDLTRPAIAGLLGLPLEFSDEVWGHIIERYRFFGRAPAESNRVQAQVPRGADILRNRWGTAPGLWIDVEQLEGGFVVMLPGVPYEMRMLTEHELLPRLRSRATGTVVRSRTLRTVGVAESTLAESVGMIEPEIAPLTLAYLPGSDGVDLRLTAWHLTATEADDRLEAALSMLRQRVGRAAYGEGDMDLAAVVLDAARRRGVTLAVAESCTGGLVGGRLTAVSGASDVFLGGVVAYADAVKVNALGVPLSMIQQDGAVSEPVARAMAEGVQRNFGAGLSVSITGIAGPSGGSSAKPVGTVWFATASSEDTMPVRMVFGGGRAEVRARAAQAALRLLLERLGGS
ncbi:MAG TPA: competence/damage-inducible protein A [Gemmatimonadales bacterium]|nr:competence/damage-inducible protein A [Gemmatimonadales bacterium]